MSENGRELDALRQEIVEARNQAIKTDNQVKNLTLDIRGFEKRFDAIDGRLRLTHLGVYVLLTLVVSSAAALVITVRSKSYESQLRGLHKKHDQSQAEAQAQVEASQRRQAEADARLASHTQASQTASKIFDLLEHQQESQAIELLEQLQFDELAPLEQRLSKKRFADLRHHGAEAAYRAGRQAALTGHHDVAIANLQRAMALEAGGRIASPARYMLAGSLSSSKRWAEAAPLWRELLKANEPGVAEEASYYLAAALAHLGKRDEASAMFRRLVSAGARYAASSRAYLSALDNGFELPTDLPGGRVRLSKQAGAASPPRPPAAVAP